MGNGITGGQPFSTVSGNCYVGMTKDQAKTKRQQREFKRTDTNRDNKLSGSEIVQRRRNETEVMAYGSAALNMIGALETGAAVITSPTGIGGLAFGAGAATAYSSAVAMGFEAIAENTKTNQYEEAHKNDPDYE